METAVRDDHDCDVKTGPHGLVASYLYRHPTSAAGQADRRTGRPVGRPAGVPAARTPWSRPAACRRCRSRSRPGLHRPGYRHPGLPALPAPARRARTVLRRGPATITRAVGGIRPLLAAPGFAVPGKPEPPLRTPA